MLKIKSIKKYQFYNFFLVFYIFFTIFIPYSLNVVRLVLLIGLFVAALLKTKLQINFKRFFPFLVFWTCNVINFVHGLYNGNPGAIVGFRHDVLWAIILCVAFLAIDCVSYIILIEKVLIYTTLFLSILDSITILASSLGVNLPLLYKLASSNIFQVTNESKDIYGWFRAWHMSSYLYTIPFTICLFISGGYKELGFKSSFMIFLVVLEGITVIMSFRTAVILVTFISIVLSIFVCFFKKNNKMFGKVVFFGLAFLAVVLIANSYFQYSFDDVIQSVKEKLDVSYSAGSTNIRQIMHEELIAAWKEAPLFGWGMGASIKGFTRDPVATWAYESYYHDILFKKGIFGFSIMILFFLWIAYNLLRICKKRKELFGIIAPILIGFVCMAIGASEDPYFTTLGNLWGIYLPFGIAYNANKLIASNKGEKAYENCNFSRRVGNQNLGRVNS